MDSQNGYRECKKYAYSIQIITAIIVHLRLHSITRFYLTTG